ncbi:MAG: CDP-glycerol glycerophosphotransferase family protein [Mogibacterium sp.]|nr:CDP-glycerol glycerophosphotransferase family protein [Mogibacterium sp.]
MSSAGKEVPVIGITGMKVWEENGSIIAEGSCVIRLQGGKGRVDTDQIRIDVPVKENAAKLSFGSRYGRPLPLGASLNRFRLEIDIEEARDLDIQNKLMPVYKGEYAGRFLYSAADLKKGRNKNSRIFIHDGTAMYLRQNVSNTLFLTVRDANQYDTPEGQRRLKEAKRRSRRLKGQDIVLMYEKNCAKYEESASILYEKLIDAGYDNVYFIVDTSIPAVQNVDEKYRKNFIEKDSDKHLEYFFACNKFAATETIDHALQLRIASKDVLDKITGKGLMYVFLQHGVMYMVSLGSSLRVGFNKKKGYKLHRTVVSSELEAQHFIDLAGMKHEDLYVTGLAKFDRAVQNEGADKIIIMPTWRRWETNQARHDLRDTGYYRMVQTMLEGVPEELRDKVIILPHPLISERFSGDESFGKHVTVTDQYDPILRDCALLITDYSSIAYDAYYRGANVVFYWKDKDECMEHYGEGTHLMLNMDNVFGPVCMDAEDIRKAVAERYMAPQDEEELARYRKIVEFHDGKNSERILRLLIRDGMLEPKE